MQIRNRIHTLPRRRDIILNLMSDYWTHSRITLLGHDNLGTGSHSRIVRWSVLVRGTTCQIRSHFLEFGDVQLEELLSTDIEVVVKRVDYLVKLDLE